MDNPGSSGARQQKTRALLSEARRGGQHGRGDDVRLHEGGSVEVWRTGRGQAVVGWWHGWSPPGPPTIIAPMHCWLLVALRQFARLATRADAPAAGLAILGTALAAITVRPGLAEPGITTPPRGSAGAALPECACIAAVGGDTCRAARPGTPGFCTNTAVAGHTAA